ncbi:MAG: valine--tRNA ligase [Nitrospinota bacterium]
MSKDETAPSLEKTYNSKNIESRLYSAWVKQGYFEGKSVSEKPPYCIVIPPPNVTGALHMGHALNNTLQDTLARWSRMKGRNTLWLPGMDHAGIATQNVVEKQLSAEGTHRNDLGREKFVRRVWEWKAESGGVILNQLKRLGSSCDWKRTRFTMDEGLSRAVREVFVTLFEEGLIYKGNRLINWCPRCHTALSDLEVEHKEQQGSLSYINYPLVQDKNGKPIYITVATTRPETMLGDTALAVHPDDERYAKYIGKEVSLPLTERTIPVIADSYVDSSFGTGALKITPAHDPNDFEIGKRHTLPSVKVINEEGKICGDSGKYTGLDRYECRKEILADLQEKGLLKKSEPCTHAVGKCYRCQTAIEPNLSKQWFIKIKPLAEPAIEAVRSGRVRIIPKTWENTFFSWMENINDWCISRQIWWGHRIPAWHCDACGQFTVTRKDPKQCTNCKSTAIEQETDVLDTWFSSALWPFSTLGWPEKTEELKTFYPTSVLVTGFDILFFWVARMIMMGLKFMGEVPFRDVYIHALVRDADGHKMSKSKGNIIDPLTVIDKYGADAFRFTLAAMAAQGRDIKLSEERIEGYRNFVNKIWNAFRFSAANLMDLPAESKSTSPLSLPLDLADRWILSRLQHTIRETEKSIEGYRFNDAASTLYHFFWHELCDWYIELIKNRLASAGEEKKSAQRTMLYVLENSLRLLHPIMPFITDELWQKLSGTEQSITVMPYPEVDPNMVDSDAEEEMELVMRICKTLRSIRSENTIQPGKKVNAVLRVPSENQKQIISKNETSILQLAGLNTLSYLKGDIPPKGAASGITDAIELFILLEGLIDVNEEKAGIKKETEKLCKEMVFIEKKLSNPSFVERAPEEVVQKNRAKLDDLREAQGKLKAHLETLSELS